MNKSLEKAIDDLFCPYRRITGAALACVGWTFLDDGSVFNNDPYHQLTQWFPTTKVKEFIALLYALTELGSPFGFALSFSDQMSGEYARIDFSRQTGFQSVDRFIERLITDHIHDILALELLGCTIKSGPDYKKRLIDCDLSHIRRTT